MKCRHCGSVTGYFVFDVCDRCQADGKDSRVSVGKNARVRASVPLLESGRVFLTGTPWGARASFQNNHATVHTLPESREHIDAMEYTARWHHPGVVGVDRVTAPPSPPTIREWLGDRVSELGRWADVLREQPVPAGSIVEWRWERFSEHWRLLLRTKVTAGFESLLRTSANPLNHGCGDPFFEAVQMALFTRHPDVKPEPKQDAFPWDPYPEVV